MSVEAIDQVLLEYTGLTLDETAQIGMDYFQYLPGYGAYYHSHGDTNYWRDVFISAGERKGNTIRLYYWDNFARYECDWLCVTLEVQADGDAGSCPTSLVRSPPSPPHTRRRNRC